MSKMPWPPAQHPRDTPARPRTASHQTCESESTAIRRPKARLKNVPGSECDEISNRDIDKLVSDLNNNPPDPRLQGLLRYVSVEIQATTGPDGEMYDLPDLSLPEEDNGFRFPSIIFQVSVAPILDQIEGFKDEKEFVKDVKFADRDAKWVSIMVELEPVISRNGGEETPMECEVEIDCSKYFRVLEILPNDTVAGPKDRLITQVASVTSELSGVLAPFFPGTDFETRTGAGASGLGILFRNLFPPRAVTYQYAYLNSPSSFGWYFRQNKANPESSSLLGLHRGAVLLQVNSKEISVNGDDKDVVKKIIVRYQALSEWNKKRKCTE